MSISNDFEGNRLNVPVKKLIGRIFFLLKNTIVFCLQVQKTHFISKDTRKLKVKRWNNIFYTNGNQKRADVVMLILDNRLHVKNYYKRQREFGETWRSKRCP